MPIDPDTLERRVWDADIDEARAGGGSGHGLKHGPAIGEYLAVRIVDGAVNHELDAAFALRPTAGRAAITETSSHRR